MEIALIQNGNITKVGHYSTVFPNTSFRPSGPTDEFLTENNAKKVNRFKAYDQLTEKLVASAPYDDGEFVSTVQAEALTEGEIQSAKDSAMSQIRGRRNQLLKDSDWSQGKDISDEVSSPWATYRQTLRDLPSTITEPRTFSDWPHDPNWVESVMTP